MSSQTFHSPCNSLSFLLGDPQKRKKEIVSPKGSIHCDQSFIVKSKTKQKPQRKKKIIFYCPEIRYDELFQGKPASRWLEASH